MQNQQSPSTYRKWGDWPLAVPNALSEATKHDSDCDGLACVRVSLNVKCFVVQLSNTTLTYPYINTPSFIPAAFSRLETADSTLLCFWSFSKIQQSKWVQVERCLWNQRKMKLSWAGFSCWAVEDSRLNLLNASPSSCEHKERIKFKCKFNSSKTDLKKC